jgi:hypothetical protein
MDEQQYRALCEACDRILLEQPVSPERISLAWLHVVREHPVFLERYERIFAGVLKSRWRWLGLRRITVEILRISRQMFRGLRRAFGRQAELPVSVDILFVSHRVNTAQADTDFYFGALPEHLAASGYRVAIALIDHTSTSSPHMRILAETHRNLTRLVLPNTLDLGDELIMLRDMLRLSRQVMRDRETQTLDANVRHAAAGEAIAGASFQALRIARQIAQLVERLQPGALITTHEGHAWERAAFHLARQKRALIRCVAYQHAALFRLQHAIRRKLDNGADPDMIWTSGSLAADQLRRESGLGKVAIAEIGSPRAPAPASTYHTVRNPGAAFTCLVLPEGLRAECDFLFGFSLECATAYPHAIFIWRLHPIISFESLAQSNPRLRSLPANVRISTASMQEDVALADCALYRGSTAVIQAVLAGAAPIYVQIEKEMSIDPLYEAEAGVGRITAPDQLLGAIKVASTGAGPATARDYCARMFTPLRSAAEAVRLLEGA